VSTEERSTYREKLRMALIMGAADLGQTGNGTVVIGEVDTLLDAVLAVRDPELDRLSQENDRLHREVTHLDLARVELEKWVTQETLRAESAETQLAEAQKKIEDLSSLLDRLRNRFPNADDNTEIGTVIGDLQAIINPPPGDTP
jgi:chromosome segregation ATPase